MKKFLLMILTLTITLVVLSGCTSGANYLMISEYIEWDTSECAVEIYNTSDEEVSLDSYSIGIHTSGATDLTKTVQLSGSIGAKSTYVVGSTGASSNSELAEKLDFVSDNLSFNGNDTVTLLYNDNQVDIVGLIGALGADFAEDVTYVKKTEYLTIEDSYDDYEWIRYNVDNASFLGNVDNSVTADQLLAGPYLTEEARAISFFPEGTTVDNVKNAKGTGGVVEVTLKNCGDGDTTYFNYPSEWDEFNLSETDNRVRYFGIDTPETSITTGDKYEAYGTEASSYVCNALTNATTIELQSIDDDYIFETYGRILALVYVDGQLLNHLIIANGYSDIAFGTTEMLYGDLSIGSYMYDAMLHAKKYEIGMWILGY